MARRFTCEWLACVLVLAVLGWHGAHAMACFAADAPPLVVEAEEDVPDMNFVKAQAESGRPKYQTQLADFYMAASDLTNAVLWYRKAADQGHVSAQLTLAGCLMAGRGAAKSPAEAAKLLRQAADIIESGATGPVARATVTKASTPGSDSVHLPPSGGASNAPSESKLPTPAVSPVAPVRTNAARVDRVSALLAAEPVFQQTPAVLRPHRDSP